MRPFSDSSLRDPQVLLPPLPWKALAPAQSICHSAINANIIRTRQAAELSSSCLLRKIYIQHQLHSSAALVANFDTIPSGWVISLTGSASMACTGRLLLELYHVLHLLCHIRFGHHLGSFNWISLFMIQHCRFTNLLLLLFHSSLHLVWLKPRAA